MITITQMSRNKGTDVIFNFGGPIQRSPKEALTQLIKCAVGYGGKITEFTPTRIVVEAKLLDKIDTSVFEGSEEDMKPLCQCLSVNFKKASALSGTEAEEEEEEKE